ncbi:MAG: hypothetical protein H3C36_02195 [Chitinophagaceae bacterium]|nr:hypothetical protein [Chitinophagaceae bacterium]
MKVTVLNKQSVFDIAVRYCGSAQAALEVARLNGISVTTVLVPGSELEVPNRAEVRDVVNYFESKNHQPATAWNPISENEQPKPEGISYWAINDDFVVTPQITPAP